ncbi:hypothetical protein UFOVP26_99 [uncultured Caudovirales phage]|uniref:DUF4376 domain-containing protein n=1 Tax=uncultured Caudovirales phage TaxID=2100421 RepID=A0A6J5KL38_9CAUD|nr:hypothetical protein UFOVP26_99 [uncultured Caudovirales phage]CAB4124034.1 hypothetical protein UFOVP44_136 [uncultured Caudovirales phage]CAB5219707.1 hypothetical protein UFOVP220_127 [uncultured Caudovirales phage]
MVSTSLEDAKLAKKKLIDEARGRHFLPESISYMGHEFDLTLETYNNLTSAAAFAGLFGNVAEDFVWMDYYNEPVPMTLDDLKGFVLLVKDILQYGYVHSSELKRRVDMAIYIEQVDDVPEW